MNLKKTSRRGRGSGDDVNITPVLNLFLVLVPFLLLTAVFVRIAVLELTLPALGKQNKPAVKPDKPVVVILLAINKNGFRLKAPAMKFKPIRRNQDAQYPFDLLRRELQRIKSRYPDTEEITIQPDDSVLYEVIVKVMDACRETGFPNISISG